ncbi:MAG: T9SS type A sorting domain-containing protein [Bacteroidetes bacterium]|nr:T9SS type A sorting domain-containing protein [Bacteroidota bacterium]
MNKTKFLIIVFALAVNSFLFGQVSNYSFQPKFHQVRQAGFPDINSLETYTYYEYDSAVYYKMDTTSQTWQPDKTTKYTYNATGHIISSTVVSAVGVNISKNSLTYNTNGKVLTGLGQKWKGTTYVNSYLQTFTYNAKGSQTNYMFQTWNGTGWDNSYQYAYTYDTNEKLIKSEEQNGSGTNWTNNTQINYTYNAKGKETTSLTKNWDGTAWKDYYRTTSTYDTNGNKTHYLGQTLVSTSWINTYQNFFTYNANNMVVTDTGQFYKSSARSNYYVYSYTYNSNGKRTKLLGLNWFNNAFAKLFTYTDTYDANGNIATSINLSWNHQGNRVAGGDSCNYFYSVVTDINSSYKTYAKITMYPNPATNNITININGNLGNKNALSIYDVMGRLVLTKSIISNNEVINIEGLSSGIYTAIIKNNNTETYQRIVVSR